MDVLNISDPSTRAAPDILMSMPKIEFSWYDYGLFSVMLLGSMLIGIYFGFIKPQVTATDYLMGGKKMKVLPVALSMVASAISGFTLLSVPAEIYQFGATYWLSCIAALVVAIFTYNIYLPVFYKLQVTSTYEYLKMRFNGSVRYVSSFLFILNIFLYMPITIYIPALAFQQATDISIHFMTPIICGICIFYTTIGGLKAVVWSDALQSTAMLGAMGAVFYLGLVNAGGFANIWNTSNAGGRLDIDIDVNPLKRQTLWAAVLGLSCSWIAHIGISQGSVQKFLSLPSMKACKQTTIIMAIGMMLAKSYVVLTGLMMYTKYHDCDPITTKRVEKTDQMIPFFVLDIARNIPGLPGLFIAGVFCASLSTLSALLNCVSGVVYEDFLKKILPKDLSQQTVSNILKLIVLVTGIISTTLVFVVERLGSIFPLGMKLTGLAQGPLVGLFTLGMMFPVSNSKGAITGGLTAIIIVAWMLIGAYYYAGKGILREITKPVSVDGCPFPLNTTLISTPVPVPEDQLPFFLYRISYYYYTLIGASITIIVGLIVSYLTRKKDDPPVHKDLITPLMHFLLPQEEVIMTEKVYYPIEKALDTLQTETEIYEKLKEIKR
ncbi:sodium-coupled monocarboxylate transporter [Holotrichia oblita]|uniref:Sodium-coupled monocarboxylate transporter n=1 Tax=Holotrichia oblita TaxID=644536 RepID=A0ACB9TU34_HOLOL|nr:sodium-coupled monocarboxylate transporter [Holotrichia oblita]